MVSFSALYLIPIAFGVLVVVVVSFCGGMVYGQAHAYRTHREWCPGFREGTGQ